MAKLHAMVPPVVLEYITGLPLVPLKIGIKETALQEQVRAVGGRWNKTRQVACTNGCIAGTKLEKLIVVETPEVAKKDDGL